MRARLMPERPTRGGSRRRTATTLSFARPSRSAIPPSTQKATASPWPTSRATPRTCGRLGRRSSASTSARSSARASAAATPAATAAATTRRSSRRSGTTSSSTSSSSSWRSRSARRAIRGAIRGAIRRNSAPFLALLIALPRAAGVACKLWFPPWVPYTVGLLIIGIAAGLLSEALAANPRCPWHALTYYDADHDGSISRAEYARFKCEDCHKDSICYSDTGNALSWPRTMPSGESFLDPYTFDYLDRPGRQTNFFTQPTYGRRTTSSTPTSSSGRRATSCSPRSG